MLRREDRMGAINVAHAIFPLWESFFYCYRCDGVFYPGEDKITEPSAIGELYPDPQAMGLQE